MDAVEADGVAWKSANEMQQANAKAIVVLPGQSSLAPMTLLEDKAYFFSSIGKSLIADVPKRLGAVVLGDPIAPQDEAHEIIRTFQEFCHLNDWTPGFYQTQPDLLPLYGQFGFRALKIGEEAVVDLSSFSTSGTSGQDLQTARNKLTKSCHRIAFHQPPLSRSLLEELQAVSDEWLGLMKGSEKKCSVGWFAQACVMATPVAVVRMPDGTVSALAHLLSNTPAKGITIGLMRHRADMVNGMIDFLFIALF